MENKQTAVDWLYEQLPIRMKNYLQEEIIKAKEMEKEQIIEAHIIGDNTYTVGGAYYDAAEQYYNETYGKGDSK